MNISGIISRRLVWLWTGCKPVVFGRQHWNDEFHLRLGAPWPYRRL